MDGRNSSGARVSLLNDDVPEHGAASRQPTSLAHRHAQSSHTYSQHHHHLLLHHPLSPSSSSSFASTPIDSSPPTPLLVRSDSSDSATMQRTPSPVTPIHFGFDPHAAAAAAAAMVQAYPSHHPAAASFFPSPVVKDASTSSPYPAIGQHPMPSAASAFAYHAVHPGASMTAQPPAPAALFAASAPAQQPDGARKAGHHSTASAKQPGKKNHYPCPLAKEYNCSHFFTTSGHAARHAKKHTGKKDAFCPECNKAFTRKDNMEQHRRTHQNGRNASKSNGNSITNGESSSSSSSNKRPTTSTSKPAKRPKPAPLEATAPVLVDPSLPISPASSFGYSEASLGLAAVPQGSPQVYPPELLGQTAYSATSPYALGPYYDSSNMSGLDKLAMAASGQGPRHGNLGTF